MTPPRILSTSQLKSVSPRWLLHAADMSTRTFALSTVRLRSGPDFLIVGTKRGGTTSLFNYLIQHPGILGTYPRLRAKKSTDFFFGNGKSSERWYRSHFHTETYRAVQARTLGYRPLGFEASPYYIWDPRVAPQVRAFNPSIKAILLVRDPVRRAWSHYQERVQNGVEPLTFAQALAVEDDRLGGEVERMLENPGYHSTAHDWYSYRSRGEYLPQIQNWLAHFDRDQLLVLRSEDLYTQTQTSIDDICRFLEIPTFAAPTFKAFNATWRTHADVPRSEAAELSRHYADHVSALEEFLGKELAWPRTG